MTSPSEGQMPHTFVLLAVLIVAAAIASHVIPAGRYTRTVVGGREVVKPNSFRYVESARPGLADLCLAFPRGLGASSELVFCFLIIGGALGVVTRTRVVDSIIDDSIRVTRGRGEILIPLLVVVFALGGGTIGIAGEVVLFLPGLVALAQRLGYDSITGAAIAILGAGAGVSGAFLSPFTLGLAQELAGLPAFSGLLFRLAVWFTLTSVTVAYVSRYAAGVRRQVKPLQDTPPLPKPGLRGRLVMLVLAVGLIAMLVGTTTQGWNLHELSGLYLAVAVSVAIVAGLGPNDTALSFASGAAGMTTAALVVGLARSVPLLLEDAAVTDTILQALARAVSWLPPGLRAAGMYVSQLGVSFIVPSGTGQAALTIPILAPLGDLVGVTRQTTVLAYQFGDAFSNVISPTVGYFMAALAVVEIDWTRWARFVWPLLAWWCLVGLIFVLIADWVKLGPF